MARSDADSRRSSWSVLLIGAVVSLGVSYASVSAMGVRSATADEPPGAVCGRITIRGKPDSNVRNNGANANRGHDGLGWVGVYLEPVGRVVDGAINHERVALTIGNGFQFTPLAFANIGDAVEVANRSNVDVVIRIDTDGLFGRGIMRL